MDMPNKFFSSEQAAVDHVLPIGDAANKDNIAVPAPGSVADGNAAIPVVAAPSAEPAK